MLSACASSALRSLRTRRVRLERLVQFLLGALLQEDARMSRAHLLSGAG
jgi:hypothetical protein